MKKLGLIISALALVMGLSQCEKRPNMPVTNLLRPQSVTFTTGGGQKGNFEPNSLTKALEYKWEEDDLIYVYSSTSETFDPAQGGHYCGTLQLKSGAGKVDATFNSPELMVPDNAKSLRFMHYGKKVDVSKIGDDGVKVDLSEQYGRLVRDSNKPEETAISDIVVACCDRPIDPSGNYNCGLDVQFSVVKIDFSSVATTDTPETVFMSCILENGLTVSKEGKVAPVTGVFSDLKNVSKASTEYYVALMPLAKGNPIKFSNSVGTIKIGKLKVNSNMAANIYYTEDGASMPLEDVITLPDKTLPGVFTVGERASLHFAEGNLWCNASNSDVSKWKWSIESNQWKCASYYHNDHISLFYWSTKGNESKDGGYGAGKNFVKSESDKVDWGEKIDGSKWTTLTKNQFMNLIHDKDAPYPRPIKTTKDNFKTLTISGGSGNTISGYLIVPDNFRGKLADIKETKDLAAPGILFLPAAGHRKGDVYQEDDDHHLSYGYECRYWTQTKGNSDGNGVAWNLRATSPSSTSATCYVGDSDRNRGYAVRLVAKE
ncbi:MAG: hypothetical protein Q4F69_02335 [Bacteroidia bacterium]|nr:hypothetical protein [Bacteroidia bacterium]